MMIDKVFKVMNTVKYMTLRQWKYRLYYTVRNKLKKRIPKVMQQEIEPFLLSTYYTLNIGNKDAVIVADGILKSEFPTVSGIVKKFDGDWDLQGEEYRLISFKLNSFRWLLDLSDAYKITGDRKYIDKGLELIRDWSRKNGSLIIGDKWNAYVIAERITNWIGFCSEYSGNEIKQYVRLIYPQVQELKDSLEYQLGANHLLSEAKALLFAGIFLRNDDLYRTGKQLLINEAKEQFLPDGGHYERSISYHIESLQQYFEAYAVMKSIGDLDVEKLVEIMKEPYKYLNGMIGINGKFPLFNDSAYDYPFYEAADFIATAFYVFSSSPLRNDKALYFKRWGYLDKGKADIVWDTKVKYDNTGFVHYPFTVGDKAYSFFMDCGDNGPDYNLGHTHADALSILLLSKNKEILVDSGIFTYKLGKERDECRSTKAHNTVEIDGRNSAEIWSAFRVAKRGHTIVSDYSWRNGLRIKASHDGYEKCLISPVKHTREVNIRDGYIIIDDWLECKNLHNAIARFHIGPDCRVVQSDKNVCIIDDDINLISEQEIKIIDCDVASMFGLKQLSKCIEIDFNGITSLRTIFVM